MTWLVCARLATFGWIPHSLSRVQLLNENYAVGTVSLFALIVMSLSANLIAIAAPFYFAFSRFALATSILTLGSVIPMYALALGHVRSWLAWRLFLHVQIRY